MRSGAWTMCYGNKFTGVLRFMHKFFTDKNRLRDIIQSLYRSRWMLHRKRNHGVVMADEKYFSKPLRLDPSAESESADKPAFLTRPQEAPVYYGFPLIEGSKTHEWYYGAITEFEDPEGCEAGDGFVQAPNGERAGLVWQVGTGEVYEILPPDEERWGVYGVWFPRLVRNTDDIVFNFRFVLPELQTIYERINRSKR